MNEWPGKPGHHGRIWRTDMSNGLFQNLPGSHEMAGVQALPNEPWLLPISDRAAAAVGKSADELQAAVRQAARPFWLFANGWTPAAPRSAVTVAQATPPTLAPQTASLQR